MDHPTSQGHLDIAHWLHENCSEGFTVEAMEVATTFEHLEILLLLHANRIKGSAMNVFDDGDACIKNMGTFQWLNEHYPDAAVIEAPRAHASYMPTLLDHMLGLADHE